MAISLMNKYLPLNTIIHRLDPRSKIFLTITYLIAIFIANSIIEFIILFLLLFVIQYLEKVNIRFLIDGFKPILVLVLFTSVVHLIFNKNGVVLISLLGYNLYTGALISTLLIAVRFFLVVSIMILFTASTSPSQITQAIEQSLNPFKKIGVPIETFALLVSISLRFIPTIGEETERIINSQISRGANIKSGSFINRVKSFIPILIPIFISTLKRADELAIAMEVRGYVPGANRTRYKQLRYNKKDAIVYLVSLLLIVLLIVL